MIPARRHRRLGLVVLLLLAAVGGVLLWRSRASEASVAGAPFAFGGALDARRRVPDSVRVRVEVLNATRTRGLARRATSYLRERGFDVVSAGNAPEQLDSSRVVVHAGTREWGDLAAELLGGGAVEIRPDTSRYLDLTVILGASWRPPPDPLHP
ncbi:MAG TPA: LytR C-terminal domain-containing protein [Gemmatimonadaceae bacterium]|nr:LytR C-terminal domain-containing protein [Gemmatimonadaceae bacterium]